MSTTTPSTTIPKPPAEPDASDCCGSGCTRCVWDVYYDKLAEYDDAMKKLKEGGGGNNGGGGVGVVAAATPVGVVGNGMGGANDDYDDEDEDAVDEAGTTANKPLATTATTPQQALLARQLPTGKAVGSIVVRYNSDGNDVPMGLARQLMAEAGVKVKVSNTNGTAGGAESATPLVVLPSQPANTTFIDYILPAAEGRKRTSLSSNNSGGAHGAGSGLALEVAVTGASAPPLQEEGTHEEVAQANAHTKTTTTTSTAATIADIPTAVKEANALLKAHVLQEAIATADNELAQLQAEVRGSRRLMTIKGNGSTDTTCAVGDGSSSWGTLMHAEFIAGNDTIAASLSSTHHHPDGPLVPLRVSFTATTSTTADGGVANMTTATHTSNSSSTSSILPGDVLELLVPNDITLCEQLCKRLKLNDPTRRLALLPSPFASPNSFPQWLAPATVGNHIIFNGNANSNNGGGIPTTTAHGGKTALDNGIDGLLQAQQAAEERIVDRFDEENSITRTPSNSADPPNNTSPSFSPAEDMGTVTNRSILSLFRHYVDITSSAYLRPPFFAMLCRVAEATSNGADPPTRVPIDVSQAGTTTSPSPLPPPTDAELLRFLAVGMKPSQIGDLLEAHKPSMLTVLDAFPKVTPQLPRLLEVCTPLRPKSFSVAGTVAPTNAPAVGAADGNNAVPSSTTCTLGSTTTVELFVRAFGADRLLAAKENSASSDDAQVDAHQSSASAALRFRKAVEELFMRHCYGADITYSSSAAPLGTSSSATAAGKEQHSPSFLGHTSGALVTAALTNSSSTSSSDDPLSSSSSRKMWARLSHVREQPKAAAVNNGSSSPSPPPQPQKGLFPKVPIDKPLILVSAGSGYAPLRTVLQERLRGLASKTSAGGTKDVTTSTSSASSPRTVLLCAVKTCEEAFLIEQLLQRDVAEAVGVGGGDVGSGGGGTRQKRPRSADGGSNADTTTPIPSTTSDIEELLLGHESANNSNNSSNPHHAVIFNDIERHFFVSSPSSCMGTTNECSSPPAALPPPLLTSGCHTLYVHKGRLVDWAATPRVLDQNQLGMMVMASAVGGGGSGLLTASTLSSSSSAAKARLTLPANAPKLLGKYGALARFPSTIVSRLLFAAMGGMVGGGTNASLDPTVLPTSSMLGIGSHHHKKVGAVNQRCSNEGSTCSKCATCPNRLMGAADGSSTSVGNSNSNTPTTTSPSYNHLDGAAIYACGPTPFLSTFYRGLHHLAQWGPSEYDAALTPAAASANIGSISSATDAPPLSSSPLQQHRLKYPPADGPNTIPLLDDSEAEYEVRKLFLGNRVVFDYWQE